MSRSGNLLGVGVLGRVIPRGGAMVWQRDFCLAEGAGFERRKSAGPIRLSCGWKSTGSNGECEREAERMGSSPPPPARRMLQVQGHRSAGGAQVSMMGNGWRGTPRQAVLGQVVPQGPCGRFTGERVPVRG